LLGRHSTTWATSPAQLLVIFPIGSWIYAQINMHCHPTYLSHTAGMTGVHHHVILSHWLRWGSYKLFARASLEQLSWSPE
jgi:hypothetical protein